jgi:hypothetical protein
VTHYAFKMPDATAPTEILLWVESNDGVAAFSCVTGLWVASVAYPTSQEPYSNKFIQMSALGGYACGHGIGVIQDMHLRVYAGTCKRRGQRTRQVLPFHLRQVRALLDYSSANDSRKRHADRVNRASQARGADLLLNLFGDLISMHLGKRIGLLASLGKSVYGSGDLIAFNSRGCDVLGRVYTYSHPHEFLPFGEAKQRQLNRLLPLLLPQ